MPTPVEEIKERLDIVEVIGKYVPLKKTGHNFKGLCPFHPEKTPSFIVFPDDGHYHCFGCGQNGDIFTFVMKRENLEFSDALRLLADQAGVTLISAPEAIVEDRTRDRLREINAAAAHYYHNLLLKSTEGKIARDFLARRGVNDHTIAGWELGYSLDSWDALTHYLTGKGYSIDDLLAAGLVRSKEDGGRRVGAEEHGSSGDAETGGHADDGPRPPSPVPRPPSPPVHVYDYFRRRVMFPIRDAKGNVTGFGARTLGDDQPKFLNSPQTLLFDKSASLYGIDHAKDTIRSGGQAVIVEGYLDVLIAHQMGITNVVASLGTSLTERQLGILKKLGKRLILALDADVAGDEATLRGLAVAREVMDEAMPVTNRLGLIHFEYRLGVDLRILSLPRGEDPDEVILRSVAEWQQLVRNSLSVGDFYFNLIASRQDLSTPKGKSAAVDQLLTLLREIDDHVARAHYLSRLAALVQIDERVLQQQLLTIRPKTVRRTAQAGPVATPEKERKRTSVEDYCLSLLLRNPELYWKVEGQNPDDFADAANRQIFSALQTYLAGGNRFDLERFPEAIDPALHDPLAALARTNEKLPEPPEDELENAVVVAALRIRLANRKNRLQKLAFAQRDPEVAADAEQTARLKAASDELGQEIGYLQKALDERTILGRRKAGGG